MWTESRHIAPSICTGPPQLKLSGANFKTRVRKKKVQKAAPPVVSLPAQPSAPSAPSPAATEPQPTTNPTPPQQAAVPPEKSNPNDFVADFPFALSDVLSSDGGVSDSDEHEPTPEPSTAALPSTHPSAAVHNNVIYSAWGYKRGKNNSPWKRRFFVLRSSGISYYVNDTMVEAPKGVIWLNTVMFCTLDDRNLQSVRRTIEDVAGLSEHEREHAETLAIVCGQRVWKIRLEDATHSSEWYREITTLMPPSPGMANIPPLKEGYLKKKGVKNLSKYKRRYCVLRGSHLLYFEKAQSWQLWLKLTSLTASCSVDDVVNSQLLGAVALHGAFIQQTDVPREGCGVEVRSKQRTYYLLAEAPATAEAWVAKLRHVSQLAPTRRNVDVLTSAGD